jgi:hypothetical protein
MDILTNFLLVIQSISPSYGRECHRGQVGIVALEAKGSNFFHFFSSEMILFRRKA